MTDYERVTTRETTASDPPVNPITQAAAPAPAVASTVPPPTAPMSRLAPAVPRRRPAS